MSTTNATHPGSEPTPRDVSLNRVHAQYVVGEFLLRFSDELWAQARDINNPEDVDGLRGLIDDYAAILEQLGWGNAGTDVTLRLSKQRLVSVADVLIEIGADRPRDARDPGKRRAKLREAEAGAAILDQPEATR
jgi:hypothetical protein